MRRLTSSRFPSLAAWCSSSLCSVVVCAESIMSSRGSSKSLPMLSCNVREGNC